MKIIITDKVPRCTTNKKYNVEQELKGSYLILNDDGCTQLVGKDKCKKVKLF